jgi:adenylosuccinate synthase
MLLLLLSGPVAVGKSSVAYQLVHGHGFRSISSGRYLEHKARKRGTGISRSDLQQLGDSLDVQTDYRWLVEDIVIPAIDGDNPASRWLLDSVRKERQIHHIRAHYAESVCHVHFSAPEHVLRGRYEARSGTGGEYAGRTPYTTAIQHPNELEARYLVNIADLVIDMTAIEPAEAVQLALQYVTGRNL